MGQYAGGTVSVSPRCGNYGKGEVKMHNTVDLSGHTVLVTGGSGVLCGEIAMGLGASGATVALLARSKIDRARELAERICLAGGRASAFQGDVLNKSSLLNVRDQIESELGVVDILVNGAGGAKPEATTSADRSFFDLPEAAVRGVFDLNFLGTFLPCQVFAEHMVSLGRGRILNIASLGALRPLTRSVAYSAAKAAIVNFTQWLAVHMSQEYSAEIRVNALVPGFFLTEQNRFLLTESEDGKLTERGRRIIAHTPMGRLGTPGDLVAPALALLSDGFAFVHGTALIVDGGLAAFGGV